MTLKSTALDKIILLYVMDTMEIPLTCKSLAEMCSKNEWINYFYAIECVNELVEMNYIVNVRKNNNNEELYVLTADGKNCIRDFFTEIPLSKRDDIKKHVRENRNLYRRKQDYFSDYYKNDDGSYTVILKILTSATPLLDLKLCVQSKSMAKWLEKSWVDKAPLVYELISQNLFE